MENILLYGIIILIIIIITLVILIIINIKLSKKVKNFTLGKNGKSLESIILENNKLSKEIVYSQFKNFDEINNLKEKLKNTIQHVSIVRFNALKNSGGLQSFSIALLDGNKNGVVISSMYTRENTNIFAKEIINGKSKHKLTEEEIEALEI